jgi:hypothetical protein
VPLRRLEEPEAAVGRPNHAADGGLHFRLLGHFARVDLRRSGVECLAHRHIATLRLRGVDGFEHLGQEAGDRLGLGFFELCFLRACGGGAFRAPCANRLPRRAHHADDQHQKGRDDTCDQRLVPPRKFLDLVRRRRRACGNRLVTQKAPDVLGELRRGAVTALFFLLQRFADDGFHVRRYRGHRRRRSQTGGLLVFDDSRGLRQ